MDGVELADCLLNLSPVQGLDLHHVTRGWIGDLKPVEAHLDVTAGSTEALDGALFNHRLILLMGWFVGFAGSVTGERVNAVIGVGRWQVKPASVRDHAGSLPVVFCCQGARSPVAASAFPSTLIV